jgi:hypothetical protein
VQISILLVLQFCKFCSKIYWKLLNIFEKMLAKIK